MQLYESFEKDTVSSKHKRCIYGVCITDTLFQGGINASTFLFGFNHNKRLVTLLGIKNVIRPFPPSFFSSTSERGCS